MANCVFTGGLQLGCRNGIGGIRTVYLTNFSNIDTLTGITLGDSYVILSGDGQTRDASIDINDIVTNVTNSSGGTVTFYEFQIRRETGEFKETITSSIQNGTLFYEPNLTIFLEKYQTYIRNRMLLIAQTQVTAIVEDKLGNFWLLGKTAGLDLLSGEASMGKASADANGYTLTFTGQEPETAIQVDPSIIASLI